MKLSHILGINARTKLYSYPYNSIHGKRIARSKIQSERVLRKAGIPTPRILKKFRNTEDIEKYDWEKLHGSFVIKPSKGLGGDGIIVVKKRLKNKVPTWLTANKRRVQIADFKLHVLDILEGAYSIGNVPDVAFIQEYVGRHKSLQRYAFRGTPDIRVIVFNKVPVMAMLRLPTRDSDGRSNLHQGAIGVGVDIATGITTRAIWYGDTIKETPDHGRRLSGIKIRDWSRILEISVESQMVTKLGYLGVDVVVHPQKGPMVMELNSSPGLQIQLANMAGLRKRIDRIDDLEVSSAAHGITIAKAVFSPLPSKKIKKDGEPIVIGSLEEIKIYNRKKKQYLTLKAKIDTGAWRTSIDKSVAEELGLMVKSNILWTKTFKSAIGKQERPVIALTYSMRDIKITTIAGVADRKNLRRAVIIGRRDLGRFLIKPSSYVIKK
jgi:alpha-L-glutamate ligase-like protein